MLLALGDPHVLLPKLFRQGDDGHLSFGPACSVAPVTAAAMLGAWVAFDDNIMEGHVRYDLRARRHPRGLLLEIRLSGSNRDQHVPWFVAEYMRWAGCPAVSADAGDGV